MRCLRLIRGGGTGPSESSPKLLRILSRLPDRLTDRSDRPKSPYFPVVLGSADPGETNPGGNGAGDFFLDGLLLPGDVTGVLFAELDGDSESPM